jgi:hypothetical protein
MREPLELTHFHHGLLYEYNKAEDTISVSTAAEGKGIEIQAAFDGAASTMMPRDL